MLALALAGAAAPEEVDLDAFVKATLACDRNVVTTAISAASRNHAQFLLDAYKDRSAIADARVDLAERRRKVRAREASVDTEAGLALVADDLDERARALAERRALDQARIELIGEFRALYLRQCSVKGQ